MKKLLAAVVFFGVGFFVGNAYAIEHLFTHDSHPQEWCLAQNIYYEARGSSLADQIGVADVVLNRVNDNRYPNTVCGVVRQGQQDNSGRMIRNKCQFSWYCDGKSDWPKEEQSWKVAQYLAWKMINDKAYLGITEGATNYHAEYISPKWAKHLYLIGQIGEHIYYRRK